MTTDDSKLHEFLSLLDGVQNHGDYWTARCPGHEDSVSSLSISRGDKAAVILKCHAGCTVAQICHGAGVTVSSLFPDHGQRGASKSATKPKGAMVAAYDYRDEDGVLLRQSCRYEFEEDGVTKKRFVQRRPNGTGGWINSASKVRNVPYRLPELVKSHKSELVIVVEGEKHVDRLIDLGFVATCNVGGAGKWLASFKEFFVGRDVVILPDNDDAGKNHAADVAAKLKESANSIRCVELPNLPPKGDIIDWLAAGGTADQLRALIAAQPVGLSEKVPPKGDPVTEEKAREIVESLGLDVFGEDEDGKITVFSVGNRKKAVIRDIDRLSFAKLIQICGSVARQIVFRGQDEAPEGMVKMDTVKSAIAELAGSVRIGEDVDLGVGVWKSRESVILVGAGEAAILNGSGLLHKQTKPRYEDHILDLGGSDPWFDYDTLAGRIQRYSPEWAASVVAELEDIFGRWHFGAKSQAVMPAILSGLVLATWTQTVWRWRPQVFILGKSNSGKTTLFEFLAGGITTSGLFGDLVVSSGDATASGISQTVRNSARAVILDEVENSRRRDGVLEMLRNAGRGGRRLRGSAHHNAVSTGLRHIVWAAATESGLKKEVDRNRFIIVNLRMPPADDMGKLKLPPEDATVDLGQRLLAVAAKTSLAAADLSERLKERRPTGYHYRIVESYSVPVAAYAAAMGMDEDGAATLLEEFLATTDPSEIESDEDRLLDAIRNTIIDVRPGVRESIQQVVWRYSFEHEYEHTLARYGMAVLSRKTPQETWCGNEETCVFFDCTSVAKNVLSRDDEWRGTNVKEIMSRLPGAVDCRKQIAGRRPRGILIPLGLVVENMEDGKF